jgi:hypothetical protein
MDGPGHTYVISDVSTNGKIRVDALGYLEISVTATNTFPPSTFPLQQGQNRFTANVVINGTTWNQTKVGLIVNFVGILSDELGFSGVAPLPSPLLPATFWTFDQGGGNSALLLWRATVQPFPPEIFSTEASVAYQWRCNTR